jgi:hypothetical protein
MVMCILRVTAYTAFTMLLQGHAGILHMVLHASATSCAEADEAV